MKKYLLLFFLLFTFLTPLWGQQTVRALFLGNSYTNFNTLPAIVASLANANGDTLIHDWNVPGGYTLEGHSTNGTSLGKIAQGSWDFLVMQEQSQRPSFPPLQVQQDVYPFAEVLVDSFRSANSCAQPVFFMTWGRKNGDQQNCQFYPPLCTYEGMQGRLRSSYMEMADLNDGWVAPVGSAWWRSRILDPNLDLYTGDGSHPSYPGSYLAACVFYATLFQKSPEGLPFYGNLDSTTATYFQTIAATVVFDSLSQWDYTLAPAANFTWQSQADTVFFTNASGNYTSAQWDFGDGSPVSTDPNPVHVYPASGTYPATLIVDDGCQADTLMDTVEVVLLSREWRQFPPPQFFPQPALRGTLFLTVENLQGNDLELELVDTEGRSVWEKKWEGNAPETKVFMDCRDLPSGLYIARLQVGDRRFTRKIVLW